MAVEEMVTTPAEASEFYGIAAFVRAVLARRRRVLEVLTFTLVLALTEWVGLFLLVPLLAIVGLRDATGTAGRMADVVAIALTGFGIRPTLPAVLLIFLALVSARAVVQRLETSATSALQNEFVLALRERSYAAILRTRWGYFSSQRSSDFLHLLTAETGRVGNATYHLLRLVVHAALTAVYLALAFRLSPAMTILASVAGLVLLGALRSTNRRATVTGERVSAAEGELYAAAQEHIGGMKTARSYGTEERNVQLFSALARDLSTSSISAEENYAISSALLSIGSAALLGAFVYVAVAMLSLPTTAVLLLLLVFSRIVPRLSDAQTSYQHLIGALPAYGNVMRRILECEAATDTTPVINTLAPALENAIRLNGVSFQYDNAATTTLRSITLEIPARRTTAIVGASGAGKSTIADLVLGLIVPSDGEVLIDDRTLTPALCGAWRSNIGFVPQDTFLLHDTVRANLLWARPEADEHELREALRQAAAQEFVDRLPHGMDTRIGDRGILLSGGERQRLALARALLRKPHLLILDEATSALDSENEQRIRQAIAQVHGEMTILNITHRLTTIRDADVIHVIDEGRLVQSGTWNELIADANGRFHSLCAAQGALDLPPVSV